MFYGAGGIGEAAQAVRLKVSASFYCRNLHKMSRLRRIQRQFVHVCVLKGGAGGHYGSAGNTRVSIRCEPSFPECRNHVQVS